MVLLVSNALWACVCMGLLLALPMVRAQAGADGAVHGPRQAWLTVLGCVVFVAVVVGGGYVWLGSPLAVSDSAPVSSGAANRATNAVAEGAPEAAPDGAGHTMSFDQIGQLTQGLAERLATQPNDADGWAMLARSYNVLGRYEEAVKAYRQATALIKSDPQLLADFADALAMTQNRSLSGEPAALIKRALTIDAHNLKALYLAGTEAFERKAYREALGHWEQLQKSGPPDSEFVTQVSGAIDEARALLGVPPASAKPVAATGSLATAGVMSIRGRVSLSAEMVTRVRPDDTVFVFARPADGGRMPVAIVRKTVRDLPFDFVLDDSTAMTPQNRLSTQTRVLVSARVSATGQAMPQSGDVEAAALSLVPGATDVRLELSRLKP